MHFPVLSVFQPVFVVVLVTTAYLPFLPGFIFNFFLFYPARLAFGGSCVFIFVVEFLFIF